MTWNKGKLENKYEGEMNIWDYGPQILVGKKSKNQIPTVLLRTLTGNLKNHFSSCPSLKEICAYEEGA